MILEPHATQTRDDAPFGCTVHRRGQTSEIELEGELDLAAREVLDRSLTATMAPGPVMRVVVDMTAVTFADSTTVTWLVRADRRARASGAQLVTVVAPGPVLDLLELTGLTGRLAVMQDRQMR